MTRGRARHDDGTAADDLIQLDRLRQALWREIRCAVVRRVAADAEAVQQLADLLRVLGRPAVIRRVELDDLVAHLRDGATVPIRSFISSPRTE